MSRAVTQRAARAVAQGAARAVAQGAARAVAQGAARAVSGAVGRTLARRTLARRTLALAAVVLATVLAAGPALASPVTASVPASVPASVTASVHPGRTAAAAPADGPGWTLDQGEAAVRSGVISSVPGAVARVDRATVTAAIKGSSIRVVMLPFAPLDDEARNAAGRLGVDLHDWARDQDIELVQVQGLQVSMSIFEVTPTSMADLAPMLSQMDVTGQVLFAIAHLREHPKPPDATMPRERTADPAQVAAIGDALAADRIYNAPGLAAPQRIASGWDGAGLTVRAAFLPPAPLGTRLTDLLTPLHQRFPNDLTVVVRGRYLEVAGPRPQVLHSALLWTYGYYQRGVLGWQVEPTALVGLLAQRVGLLRTGVVSDQQAPSGPTDPVRAVSHALPWIFAGVAVALVMAVTGWSAFGARRQRGGSGVDPRASTRDRRALGARLAVIAGQVVAIEGLVRSGGPRKDLSMALERYRVASDVLASDGSIPVARKAVGEAERRLRMVAAAVGVPLADPTGTGVDAGGHRDGGEAR